MAIRRDSEETRSRILSSCVKLFIENGYSRTTMAEIISDAGVSNSTFQNLFRSKNGVLMDLVEFMFEMQFKNARRMTEKYENPVLIYAVETALQLAIAEFNENIREIYLEAYTFSETLEFINQCTAKELYAIFGVYKPECSESDFYELEIGTAGIMCGYMAKPCDMYFTPEKKIARFLEMTLTIYNVPKAEKEKIIEHVVNADIKMLANNVLKEVFEALETKFDFEFDY